MGGLEAGGRSDTSGSGKMNGSQGQNQGVFRPEEWGAGASGMSWALGLSQQGCRSSPEVGDHQVPVWESPLLCFQVDECSLMYLEKFKTIKKCMNVSLPTQPCCLGVKVGIYFFPTPWIHLHISPPRLGRDVCWTKNGSS